MNRMQWMAGEYGNQAQKSSRLNRATMAASVVSGLILCLATSAHAQTAGALANGLSAAATSRGGTMVAEHGDVIDAVEGNPAGLAGLQQRTLDVTGVGILAHGTFHNSVDNHGKLTGVGGALPYAALGVPLGGHLGSHLAGSLAVTPDAVMRVGWSYIDPPGTAGVTYGAQNNRSEILAMRTSAGLAGAFGKKWSAGATVGLVVNANKLKVPYIFQEQTELKGLKVLLDLKTRGIGWNGSLGAQFHPSDRLSIGAAWKSMTFVQSLGDANGSASALFSALGLSVDPAWHYRAEVDNQLPQTAALGFSWQVAPRIRWGVEGDWTDWGGAFKSLPVKLTQGTNATINSVVGSTSITDEVPLHWRGQAIVRTGVEMPLSHNWIARGGYSYMSDPVPSSTLMPLTAAILRNALSAGAGWGSERLHWDAAYQIQLPATASVTTSSLQAGEYDNSRMQLMAQSLTVSARFQF
jgi:long-subunit fatty acid transport protein